MAAWYVYLIIAAVVFGGAMYYNPDKTSDITKKGIDKGSSAISGAIDKIGDKVDETKGTEEETEEETQEESSNPDRVYIGKPDCKDSSDCLYVDGCDDECICDKTIGECYVLQ